MKCLNKNSATKPIMKAMLFAFATLSPFAVVNVLANQTLEPITDSNTETSDTGTLTIKQDAGGAAITGSANALSAMNISLLGDILGDTNVLTATKTVKVDGDIRGDGNDIKITQDTRIASALVVEVTGDIVGDLSNITVSGNGSVKIGGDFAGNGTYGNTILLGGNGTLTIAGTVGYSAGTQTTTSSTRTLLEIQGKGDMNFGSIGNNNNLEIGIADGNLVVSGTSAGTLTNSTINVSGDISFGGEDTGKLTLAGTQLISEKGNISATQNLTVSGANGKIEVQNPNGEISVLGTLSAEDSASATAKNVSANDISVDSGATISATNSITATEELSADGGILSALTISATSVSATNSSEITADTLTTDSISVDNSASITIKDALELDSLSVKNSAIITITGDKKLITAAEIALSDSSLSGVSVNGVGEGTISNFNITGTLTGTGVLGSNVKISGNSNFGSSDIDGTISGFDNVLFKDGEIAVYGDVTTIDNDSSSVSVEGDGATLTVSGNVSTDRFQIKGSTVTVGTAGAENSINAAAGILVQQGAKLTMNGDVIAGTQIYVLGVEDEASPGDPAVVSKAEVSGDMTVLNGSIDVEFGTMTVLGSMAAEQEEELATANIKIQSSEVAVGTEGAENLMSAAGEIDIVFSEVTVNGNQTAGGNIIVSNSFNTVSGNMTALSGRIILSSGTVAVSGNITARGVNERGNGVMIFGSEVTVGTADAENSISSVGSIYVGDSNVTVNGDLTSEDDIQIRQSTDVDDAQTSVVVSGSMTASSLLVKNCTPADTDAYGLEIGKQLVSDSGLELDGSKVKINVENVGVGVEEGEISSVIGSEISAITLKNDSTLRTGDVVIHSDDAEIDVSGGSTFRATSLKIRGTLSVTGDDESYNYSVVQTDNDFSATGTLSLSCASVMARGNLSLAGTISISESYAIAEDGQLSIVGSEGALAVIDNESGVYASGAEDVVLTDSAGENKTVSAALILDNVRFEDESEGVISGTSGKILIRNTVEVKDYSTIGISDSYTYDSTDTNQLGILLDNGATLKFYGRGEVTLSIESLDNTAKIINADGVNKTELNVSALDYNGIIDVTSRANHESGLIINSAGVGSDAVLILKDSGLSVLANLPDDFVYADSIDPIYAAKVSLGTVDTTADTGTNASMLASGLGIPIGTVIELSTRRMMRFTSRVLGDISVNSLKLSEYTFLAINTAQNSEGNLLTDKIELTGTLDANGARIALLNLPDESDIENIKNVQIISFADGATVASGFSSDVIYETETAPDSGIEQRVFKKLNAHIETDANGVNLVFSPSVYGLDAMTQNQAGAANLVESWSNEISHVAGTTPVSTVEKIVDAFDYTTSESAVREGLDSLSGATATVVQHSMMDGTRNHLALLRRNIALPNNATAGTNGFATWAAISSDYDSLNGDSNMGSYSRTNLGAIVGIDKSLCENTSLGIAVSYDYAISRSTMTKAKEDIYGIDLYVATRTGKLNHRASIGYSLHDFDVSRGVYIAAGTHSFSGEASGSMNARTISLGYEISTDIEMRDNMKLSPFFSIDLAHHSFDELSESGLEDASLKINYDSMNQLDLGLGVAFSTPIPEFKIGTSAPTFFASAAFHAEISDRDPEAEAKSSISKYEVNSLEREWLFIRAEAGVSVPISENWSAAFSADTELGIDRASIGASLSARCVF